MQPVKAKKADPKSTLSHVTTGSSLQFPKLAFFCCYCKSHHSFISSHSTKENRPVWKWYHSSHKTGLSPVSCSCSHSRYGKRVVQFELTGSLPPAQNDSAMGWALDSRNNSNSHACCQHKELVWAAETLPNIRRLPSPSPAAISKTSREHPLGYNTCDPTGIKQTENTFIVQYLSVPCCWRFPQTQDV